ncbi:MAG: Efflux transporter, family, subunit [Verrucomicrobiales bacterium]|nr:Efflux transporter, family, subunit [Verrucomicrobiales bacterium]
MNVPNSPASSDAPKRSRRLVTPGRCAALIILIGLVIIVTTSRHSKVAASTASLQTVPTTSVSRDTIWRKRNIQSEFRPYQEVDLHAKVSGYVQTINVDVGDRVKEGDLIATLEIPELVADLEHAEAVSRRSQEEVKRAQAAFNDAHLTLTRLTAVQKARPNLVAQQDIDAANAKDQAAAANLGAEREQATVSLSDVKKLKVMQTYAQITAPFAGVITKRYADKGALIQAGTSSSTQAMPLVRLSQNDRLRLVFPVQQSDVAQVKPGNEVEIEVPALSRAFKGTITRITDKIEMATRSMDAEVDLKNPDLNFIPGMYASVNLTLDRKSNALVLPVEAVSRGKSATVMFVAPDGTLEERTIQPGLDMPTKIEILSGLKEGDQVMVGSRALVHPGQRVIAKPVTLTAEAK